MTENGEDGTPGEVDTAGTDALSMTPPMAVEPDPTAPSGRTGAAMTAGILAVVLVIMGVGMLVAQIVSGVNGQPGPGALVVGAHVAGAVIGVCCYRAATRGRAAWRLSGLVALPLVIVVLLVVFWLAPF